MSSISSVTNQSSMSRTNAKATDLVTATMRRVHIRCTGQANL